MAIQTASPEEINGYLHSAFSLRGNTPPEVGWSVSSMLLVPAIKGVAGVVARCLVVIETQAMIRGGQQRTDPATKDGAVMMVQGPRLKGGC